MSSGSASRMSVFTMKGSALAGWCLRFTTNNRGKRHVGRCAPSVTVGPPRATGLCTPVMMNCKRLVHPEITRERTVEHCVVAAGVPPFCCKPFRVVSSSACRHVQRRGFLPAHGQDTVSMSVKHGPEQIERTRLVILLLQSTGTKVTVAEIASSLPALAGPDPSTESDRLHTRQVHEGAIDKWSTCVCTWLMHGYWAWWARAPPFCCFAAHPLEGAFADAVSWKPLPAMPGASSRACS